LHGICRAQFSKVLLWGRDFIGPSVFGGIMGDFTLWRGCSGISKQPRCAAKLERGKMWKNAWKKLLTKREKV
jgi:hypothetical protein